MSRSQTTIYLKDYQPPAFDILNVDLEFEFLDTHTLVKNTMALKRSTGSASTTPLVLDGHDLKLLSLKLDGQLLDSSQYQVDPEGLTLANTPETFQLEILTEIHPKKNKSFEGLYFSNGGYVTQNEAQGFRKITYFLDRPDVMTTFSTTLIADKSQYPVLLSNGNLVSRQDLEGGRHLARWEDPFKKPCYLYAVVAADLGSIQDRFVTMTGREIDLRIYCEKGNEARCLHAMNCLKLAMKWDEDTYGREYDLDIYMIVAVDNFNAGAMENKGLNIFNSVYVLANEETATDKDYESILSVIAHEYFHNWSGNRVTCRDWFQLSLKEGLTVFRDQEFSMDMTSKAVKRIEDVNNLRTQQFAEDAGPTAHPVRPQSVISVDNFFTVTIYEKGAELIRMIQTLLGRDGFRKGMDLYFARHDGQAVTTEDFVAAMEEANDVDLTQFQLWYHQAGTPVVKAQGHYDDSAQTFELTLEQSCPETPGQKNKKPFHIPVRTALLDEKGQNQPLHFKGHKDTNTAAPATEKVLHLKGAKQVFTFEKVTARPIPSLCRDLSAPVKLEYNYSREELAFLMAHETNPFNQWEAGQQLILRSLISSIQDHNPGHSLQRPHLLLESYGKVIANEHLDEAFKAHLLSLPEESYVAQFMDVVDVDAIHHVRQELTTAIAQTHSEALETLYKKLHSNDVYKITPQDIGRRSLKNSALALLCDGTEDFYDLAYEQLKTATNMTDEITALSLLVRNATPWRDQAVAMFYEKWQSEALVINKLLRVVATAPLADTLERVRAYMKDPVFNIENPNKVYALLMGFGTLNPTQFHQRDGEGYGFMAEQVLKIDPINPHVASYLASSFNHWQKLASPRKELMKEQLERMAAQKGLSGNTYEIISKNLASEAT